MRAFPKVPCVLISMPWATSTRPSLSLGILSAVIRAEGGRCDVLYPNVFMSALMGHNGYEYIAHTPAFFGLAEHLFAVTMFGGEALGSDAYLASFGDERVSRAALFELRDRIVPDLLDAYTEELLRRDVDVVGFTCTFNQVLPSVALAKRLRSANPRFHILLGGPCVHAEMGIAYSQMFSKWVDGVFLGEADLQLREYLNALGRGEPVNGMPGIARNGRGGDAVPLFETLNSLPTPDYSDWFKFRDELTAGSFTPGAFHSLPFEASRGCWWGEKHHCTFCGLNNQGMRYRRKSVQKVIGELTSLAEKHAVTHFMAADNILDYAAYRELLPALAALPARLQLFFEIKANVRRSDVELLAAAGVNWVQPGFESFSDHVLALMRKGTTALQNVQALKWLNEFGIQISYNILVGFPGETDDDYAVMLRLIPKLHHLPPPAIQANVVQVQRFAPFHFDREAQGIGAIRPAAFYERIVPRDLTENDDFAYFFDRDIDPDSPLARNLDAMNDALAAWSANEARLSLRLDAEHVHLNTATTAEEPLSRIASAILVLSDETIAEPQLFERISFATSAEIASSLAELDDRGLIVRMNDHVLGLIPFSKPQSSEGLRNWWTRRCAAPQDACGPLHARSGA